MVIAQLSIQPDISLKDCQMVVSKLTKPNFYKIKKQWKDQSRQSIQKNHDSSKRKKESRNSPGYTDDVATPSPHFIDNPDELLMSVSIRQLNKPDPDPRWASILINAKKAKITTKGEDIELQRLSVNSLVQMLRESLPQELSKDENNSLLDSLLKA